MSDAPNNTPTPNQAEESTLHATRIAAHPHHHWLRKSIFLIITFLLLGSFGFGMYAYSLTKSQIIDKEGQENFFGQVRRIVDKDAELLNGEEQDRVNILLLGQGGKKHEGGLLADTIMVASIQPSTNRVALLSIPRDLQVAFYPSPTTKIPSYYKINSSTSRGGVTLAIEKVEEVTGLSMHYYMLIDFDGFRDVVNTIGGVDVVVDNAFTDREYPDYKFGYQTITFKAGVQHMDGERALQFTRSRHGNNSEGSDFARARRQQKVLEATREKVLSASTLLNPAKMNGLMNDLGDHVSTNIEIWEMARLAGVAQSVDTSAIVNTVIDTSPNGLLVMDGGWIVPRAGLGVYDEIHALTETIFDASAQADQIDSVSSSALAELQKSAIAEKAQIVVQNGSSVNGLASKTATQLTNEKLSVEKVGNARVKTITTTVIYDISQGKDTATAQYLASLLDAEVVQSTVPSADSLVRVGSDLDPSLINMELVTAKTDIVVLVGADAK